jgi:hypothetical protein
MGGLFCPGRYGVHQQTQLICLRQEAKQLAEATTRLVTTARTLDEKAGRSCCLSNPSEGQALADRIVLTLNSGRKLFQLASPQKNARQNRPAALLSVIQHLEGSFC